MPGSSSSSRARIRRGRYQALRAANKELFERYWNIGEAIHRRPEILGWGKAVDETLAKDLRCEFPERNGLPPHNLWSMRDFYPACVTKPNLQPLVAEISWMKNLVIMARCKDDLAREFYVRATARCGRAMSVGAVRDYNNLKADASTFREQFGRARRIHSQRLFIGKGVLLRIRQVRHGRGGT